MFKGMTSLRRPKVNCYNCLCKSAMIFVNLTSHALAVYMCSEKGQFASHSFYA